MTTATILGKTGGDQHLIAASLNFLLNTESCAVAQQYGLSKENFLETVGRTWDQVMDVSAAMQKKEEGK